MPASGTILSRRPNILVKCDSLSRAVQDDLIGVPGASDSIYLGLEFLRSSDFIRHVGDTTNLGISMVPTQLNYDGLLDVFEFALSIGAYPCIGELETKGRAKLLADELELDAKSLQELKDKIAGRFGIEYTRPLCPGIFCSLHISENGECIVEGTSGLSCAWFLPDAQCLRIGNVVTESIEDLWTKVLQRRANNLATTTDRLRSLTATIGMGGGGSPSTWVDKYVDATRRAVSLRL